MRAAKGGLVAAVAEAWTPDGYHSHGLLLEDDIEVSPLLEWTNELLRQWTDYSGH